MSLYTFFQLPSIPEGVTDEGLLAVLFVFLVGAAVLIYVVSKGYLRLGKADGSEEIARLSADIERLIESCEKLTAAFHEFSKLVTATNELSHELRGLRANIHTNMMPTLAGLALAFMRLARLDDLADREEKRFNDEGIKPRYPTK